MGDDLGISIEGYEVIELLGQGGMGTVYKARQLDFERHVAIKVIHPHLVNDRSLEARFRSEMRIAISLHHPHIVPVYAAGESNGSLFIAMGLVPGEDLGDLIAKRQGIPPEEAIGYVRQIASALDDAHSRQFVHRDVKPGNVLIDNRVPHAYLTDFGLARSLDASQHLTGTGQAVMTPEFAAPEQIEGQDVDARADVYALACVLFRSVTNESAFPGDSPTSVIWAKMNGSRTPRLTERGLPPSLDPVIDRALADEPDERFTTAGEFADEASAALVGSGRRVPPPPPAPPLTEPASKGGRPPRRQTSARDAQTVQMREKQPGGDWLSKAALTMAVFALLIIAVGATLMISDSSSSSADATGEDAQGVGRTSADATSSTGDGSSSDGDQTRPRKPSRDGGTATSYTTFTGARYIADIPTGWNAESIDEPESGTRLVSQWLNPEDNNTSVLIDSSDPGPDVPPIDSAATVRAQTSQSSDYSEVSFGETSINGVPAAEWVFDIDGDRRVDYFFNSCGMGFAVLGSTSPADFATWEPTFRRVAESVTPYCE